ncbi:MAG: hypothetical protein A2Y23_10735 [Clostridiales bacterium GWB2_37_7]|nr:MAG: hypothetical protein A2Y23_10735 [Clostridiales bacterium GWB2_37_7]
MKEALYEKSNKCPICSNSFYSKKVRVSACRIDKRYEDFCISYKDINPLHYEILVCPHCGYAASENSFEKLSTKELHAIKDILSGKVVNRNFCVERSTNDALDSFKLALFFAKSRNAKNSIVAGLALKLAWIYREMKDEREHDFLLYALENYRIAYDKEDLPLGNLNEISVQYLLGELSRRLHKFSDAVFWFNKAVTNPERINNPRIEKLAREQWYDAKEQCKKI